MKFTEKKKPVKTIPDGVWESSRPNGCKKQRQQSPASATTDLQGNGYPKEPEPSWESKNR